MTLSIMGGVHKFMSDMFTEPDNHVVDPARVVAVSAAFSFIGLAFYDVAVLHNHFEYTNYGIGLSAVLVALGAATKLKPNSKGEDNA